MASPAGKNMQGPTHGASPKFSPYGILKIEICDILTMSDVEKLATLVEMQRESKSDILSKRQPALALLDELEKRGFIRRDDVEYLIEAFRHISHEKLAKLVEEYKEKSASSFTESRSYQHSSSRAEGDLHSQPFSSEEDLSTGEVTFGLDSFPAHLDQKCSREPIVLCKVEDDKPLVVVTARICQTGMSEDKCVQQLEFLKQKIWLDSLENLDHLSEVVSLVRKLYKGDLVKITNDELQLHLSIPNKNLKKLQTEVRSGELAVALGERFMSIMDIVEEEAGSLEFVISVDEDSIKRVSLSSSTTVHAESQNWWENPLYCDYCKVIFKKNWQHHHHTETDAHKGKLAIKQSGSPVWEHREPSSSITNGRYEYCSQFSSSGSCRNGDNCPFAHSTEELEEWQERHNLLLEDIESYSKQELPTSEEYSGGKQRSKWEGLIAMYCKEKDKGSDAVETVGEVAFLDSGNDSEIIAKGSQDVLIFLGEFNEDYVAVKQLPRQSLQKEIELHEKMKDRDMSNVLKMLCIERDRRFYYVVTPLCEQDLRSLIEGSEPINRLSQIQQINLCLDILKGLRDLHVLDILHRDLKPSNVLIAQNGEAFLADFGISRNMENQTTLFTKVVGTQCWMATECLDVKAKERQARYKKESDVQVAAFLLYYILSVGHHPFEATSPFLDEANKLMENQKKGQFNLSHLGDHFPQDCIKLLRQMLDKSPFKRPNVDYCIKQMEDIKRVITSQQVNLCNEDIAMALPEVKIDHDKLYVDLSKTTNLEHTWKFHVTSKTDQLQRIFFYHSKHDHFSFTSPKVDDQLNPKELNCVNLESDEKGCIHIDVKFQPKGAQQLFHQWVIFDFGLKKCLFKQLLVWVGLGSVNSANYEEDSWGNCKVIKYDPNSQESDFSNLLDRYPLQELPHSSSNLDYPTASNFKEYFEGMIVEEERACKHEIKRFNGEYKMEAKNKVELEGHSGLYLAPQGLFYGKISMTTAFDDSDATQLVRKWVKMVWLKFPSNSDIVYEAEIVAHRYLDLREFDNFYVNLSEQCVKDQRLHDGWKSQVEVLFKIDRLSFCKQRFAIDSFEEKHLLFPPEDMFPRFLERDQEMQKYQQIQNERGDSEYNLNHRQAEAKNFIVRAKATVPFRQGPSLLIGPFGTGKTLTLSLTIKDILESDIESKLLVCTHSNSAADLFLTDYLKQFCDEFQGGILRLYAPDREAVTVPEVIREHGARFCIRDRSGNFARATIEHIKRVRLIITTLSTSIYLVALKKAKGLFTHIFIDEAGQALETEAMMPLALAGPRTVVVLSGDHKQLRPVVVSKMARKPHFFPSMLERLFHWSKEKKCYNSHFVTDNYRMRQEILDFIGEHCYKVKNFKAVEVHHQQTNLSPSVLFSAVDGKEETRGLSYINEKEADEIVKEILKLKSSWPEDQIAVVSSYVSQVKLVRHRLRGRGLSRVNVDTVHNIQGKQFQVVFISSVRTRKLPNTDSTQRSDYDYLGVLSDEGELITAFTRARSCLHVFGDPVALCMLGRCKSIWRKYVELCKDKNTLYGPEISSLDQITSTHAVEHDTEQTGNIADVCSDTSSAAMQENLSVVDDSYDTDMEYESADSDLEDEILKELDRQNKEERKREDSMTEGNDPSVGECGPLPVEEANIDQQKTKSRKKRRGKIKYRMLQGDEQVILKRIKIGDQKSSQLEGGEEAETEEEEEDMMSNEKRKDLFSRKMNENPDDYCRCLVRFGKDKTVNGIPCDGFGANKIVLASKRKRKQALDGDEVGVKITTKNNVTYGEVMCIIKRGTDLKWKKLVCTLDPENIGLMSPIAYSSLHLYPKMFIYPKGVIQTAEGISFYQYTINRNSPDQKFRRGKKVFVRYSEMKDRLFVVHYYKWFSDEREHPYPMGIVTEELSACTSLPAGLKILRLRHGVKEKWPRHLIENDLTQFNSTWKIPPDELHRRADFRSKQVLTIGSPDYHGFDCGFHIENSHETEVQLAVHIPDVAYFVTKDSPLDKVALRRGTTFYNDLPNTMPVACHMLPELLSTNLSIFKPGEDRLSVSIILNIDRSSGTVKKSDTARSVIRCQQNLTYKHVEDFLLNSYDGNAEFWTVQTMDTLEMLHKLSTSLPSGPPMKLLACKDFMNYPGAVTLFHKLAALANTTLATKLHDMTGPKLVHHQLPPQQEELQGCDETFINDALKLLNLLPAVSQQGVNSEEKTDDANKDEFMPMLRGTHESMKNILQRGKDKIFELNKILLCMNRYPQHIASMAQLMAVTPPEVLACTERLPESANCGYSFLSPVTSYADLVTQRMLISCIEGTENPYLNEDVSHIAHLCFRQMQNAKSYEQSVELLVFAMKLRIVPHSLPAVVHSASDEKLELTYPSAKFLDASYSATSVAQCHLKPGKRPQLVQEKEKSIQIQWRNRIYDCQIKQMELRSHNTTLWLSTHEHIQHVPKEVWQQMLTIVHEKRYSELHDLEKNLAMAPSQLKRKDLHEKNAEVISEVFCERVKTKKKSSELKKYVEFNRQFNPGDVIEVHLTTKLQDGIPMPTIQLFKLTPKYGICLEHRALPVECFTEVADKLPPLCSTIEEYISSWSPLLKMLIAYNTIMNDETIVIHGVSIKWLKKDVGTCGTFTLQKQWCDDRQITLSYLPKKKKSAKVEPPDPSRKSLLSDYICIRLHGYIVGGTVQSSLEKLGSKNSSATLETGISLPSEATIVVHGIAGTTNIGRPSETENYEVEFQVTHTSCQLPDDLFDPEKSVTCSIELIPKSEPEKRMEAALAGISNGGELVKNIVLCEDSSLADSDPELQKVLQDGNQVGSDAFQRFFKDVQPNNFQKEAIQKALSQRFTVIQGPPGTGKTRTGAYLTTLLAQLNRRRGKKQQILYCGPSNKSVDVIATYLQSFETKKLKFVRVYSDFIEQLDFPIPGVESAERKFSHTIEEVQKTDIQKDSLHHIIRSPQKCTFAKEVNRMYNALKKEKLQPTQLNIRRYKDLVTKAKIEVLQGMEVILCTCNAAGHFILKENLNILQCVIDEAGMCFELDTLVPLVCHQPKQVVLIGDHKQLRPIIQEPRVKQLKADISLMEKHEEKAYTLPTQYRMHKDICAFPSKEFYGNLLETDKSVHTRRLTLPYNIWPGCDHKPRVFCHIEGVEDSQTVKTAEGNENSRRNFIEAKEVVRLAISLMENYNLDPQKLAILSQYKLQCNYIYERLQQTRYKNVKVQTIIKSQGSEWDYVILSTVRSLPEEEIPETPGKSWRRTNLGFIEDENQMNVGITRAMQGLIIVGNKNLLRTCSMWKKLLKYYEDSGSLIDSAEFLQRKK